MFLEIAVNTTSLFLSQIYAFFLKKNYLWEKEYGHKKYQKN